MEIYVLTIVWQRDSGECGSEVSAFESLPLAQKIMTREIKSAREDFKDLDVEETQFVEGDLSWSIWESENYCYNHCDITITQCELITE